MRPPLTIRRAGLEEIFPLRHAELRPGRPACDAEFDGDRDPGARHFGAFLTATGEAVACASFHPRPWNDEPAWQLRGMATRGDLIRHGIGAALLRFALAALRADGDAQVWWCNARVPAVAFYQRLGWTVVSDVFEVPTVGPHRVMLRRASPTGRGRARSRAGSARARPRGRGARTLP